MKKKYINPTAQAIQLEINPLLDTIQSPAQGSGTDLGGDTGGNQGNGSKGFGIGNDEPEYDEEL